MKDLTGLYGERQDISLTGVIDPVGILRILGHMRDKYPAEYRDFNPGDVDWNFCGSLGLLKGHAPLLR